MRASGDAGRDGAESDPARPGRREWSGRGADNKLRRRSKTIARGQTPYSANPTPEILADRTGVSNSGHEAKHGTKASR